MQQTPIITFEPAQVATILGAVITLIAGWIAPAVVRRVFNSVGKKKTDTGEQRKVFFDLIAQLQADNLEKDQALDAAQVQIADLKQRLNDCGCD
jgi:hypothetical protein